MQRILNDLGRGRDELPVVQHVMFRAWQTAKARADQTPGPAPVRISVADYVAVGGFKDALSNHADEALRKFKGRERIVEQVFCSLGQRGASGRWIRRPCSLRQLAEESGYAEADVMAVVEEFRRPERCFLMPPFDRALTSDSVIDVSHESLLRQWVRLKEWITNE